MAAGKTQFVSFYIGWNTAFKFGQFKHENSQYVHINVNRYQINSWFEIYSNEYKKSFSCKLTYMCGWV